MTSLDPGPRSDRPSDFPSAPAPADPPSPPGRSRPSLVPVVALVAAAVLGGGVAVAGGLALGAFDGDTTTTVVEQVTGAAERTPVAAGDAMSIRDIYKRSATGVVQITAKSEPSTDSFPGGFSAPAQQALGSGFVIDKAGHIVTNYHVVEGATDIEVSFSNRDTLAATVVGTDPSTDLALLKVDTSSRALTPLPLGDSDDVQVGDQVVAIGNPFGLDRTATAGIVSALQRPITAPNGYTIDHVIQTDAPINQGNSGGPLLNSRGQVIGVNSQIQTGGLGNGNVGIGFAVPSNTFKTVVAQLLETGRVDRSYIGVGLREIEPDLARTFRLPVDAGLLVERVEPGSAGAKAGLKGGTDQVIVSGESYQLGGDIIVAAAGTRVASIEDLRDVLAEHRPGERIRLEVYRGDEKQTLTVELGRQPSTRQG